MLVLASVQKAGPVGQKTAMERIDATVVAARTAAEKHGLLVIMTSEMIRQGYARSSGVASAKGSASVEYGAELAGCISGQDAGPRHGAKSRLNTRLLGRAPRDRNPSPFPSIGSDVPRARRFRCNHCARCSPRFGHLRPRGFE